MAASFGVIAFCWVLCDSLLTYLARHLLQLDVVVNAILPFVLLFAAVRWGVARTLPPMRVAFPIVVSLGVFVLGLVNRGMAEANLVGAPLLAVCAFAVGYFAFRNCDDEGMWSLGLLIVGGIYCAVCAVALLKVAPEWFPAGENLWVSGDATLVERPAITTNQNFQFMYLLPGVLVLAMPFRSGRFVSGVGQLVVALWVLIAIQTRSGILVMGCVLLLLWISPLFSKGGRWRMALLPALGLFGSALWAPKIMDYAAPVLMRFGESDEVGGRLPSLLYLFDALSHPEWWFIPHGEEEFKLAFGDVPHSQITAMFLHGGIVGLTMWVLTFVAPLVALGRLWVKGRLDSVATVAFIGGSALFILEMTLNVPYFKQPWLWGGAVLGALLRIREQAGTASVAVRSGAAAPSPLAGGGDG